MKKIQRVRRLTATRTESEFVELYRLLFPYVDEIDVAAWPAYWEEEDAGLPDDMCCGVEWDATTETYSHWTTSGRLLRYSRREQRLTVDFGGDGSLIWAYQIVAHLVNHRFGWEDDLAMEFCSV